MNHKTIEEIEKEIVEEFSLFDSWDDKYEYIIDLGKKLPPLEDQYKIDENKVRGCQSTVWLVADYKDGKIFYKAESDAVIVKGLISMLIRVLSGHTPDEIIEAKLDFIQADRNDDSSGANPFEWIAVDGKANEKLCAWLIKLKTLQTV